MNSGEWSPANPEENLRAFMETSRRIWKEIVVENPEKAG